MKKQLLLLLLAAACSKAPTKDGSVPPNPNPTAGETGAPALPQGPITLGEEVPIDPAKVLVTIDGQAFTEEQIMAAQRPEIVKAKNEYLEKVFQVRAGGVEQQINKFLVERAAKKENLSSDAYLKREVADKVKPPSDADLKQLYDATVAQGKQLPPFDMVKSQIADYVKEQQADQMMDGLYNKLRADAKIEVNLPPMLLPKVAVAPIGSMKGDPNAPVTIVEFSDFQCGFCGKAEPTVRRLLDDYKGKIKLVYREYPLPFHDKAHKASQAALCAGDQGKYWEMHARLFENQQALDVPQLKGYARALNLDAGKFDKCLDGNVKAAQVDKDLKEGQAVGVNGTPAFFINGRPLSGAMPYEMMRAVIEHELANPDKT
jgi:protein-disulfide isomerase